MGIEHDMNRTNPRHASAVRTACAAMLMASAVLLAPAAAPAFDPQSGDYTRDDPKDVRIVTYNHAREFIDNPATDPEFNRILTALDPDAVVMQEFVDTITIADVVNRFNAILPIAGGGSWQVHFGELGGIRTVIISRYPLLLTRTNTVPAAGTRGVTMALVDLPDADYATDVYLMGVHLKCCGNPGGSEDADRQDSADAMTNWLGDARGVARPFGENVALPAGTPILMLGDFNMVGGPQPEWTLTTGDIQDEVAYGADVKGDWDNSDMTNLMPQDPFTGDTFTWQGNQSFPPSALDRIFHTDSVTVIANSFILNTNTMTAPALAAAGLQAGDTLPQNTSDHLPVVVDLRIASATCTTDPQCADGLFCNGDEFCDTNGVCQPGSDPCPGDLCNDVLDECGTCAGDGDCNDQDACTIDTCVGGTCVNQCPNAVSAFPYVEDFEAGFGAWINATSDDIDWTRLSGPTPSSNTGPSADHTTGSGFYAYIESSPPNSPSKSAIMNGPCVDLTGFGAATFSFWRHLYGSNMGSLAVDASVNCNQWTQVSVISGNQGIDWNEATIDLGGYAGSRVTLRFRGVTGDGFRSDMAIDDILVTASECDANNDCAAGLACTLVTGVCESVAGDLDLDLDVDFDDLTLFADCVGGPDVATPPMGCVANEFVKADLDNDGDVDLIDGGLFFDLLGP